MGEINVVLHNGFPRIWLEPTDHTTPPEKEAS